MSTPAGRNSAHTSASSSVDERGRVAGLQHGGVARGDSRSELPHGHVERVVPRSHLADDADGLAPDEGGVVLHVLARGLAVEVASGAGEEPDLVDGQQDLVGYEVGARLAGVLGLEVRELVGAGLHGIRDAESASWRSPGVVSPQVLEGCRRGAEGGVDILLGRDGRRTVGLLCCRVDQVEARFRRRVDVFAVDEVANGAAHS